MRSIIIIGSEGFIGSRASVLLAEKGASVLSIDIPKMKGRSYYSPQINDSNLIDSVYLNSLDAIPWERTEDNILIIYLALQSSHLIPKNELAKGSIPDLIALSTLVENIPKGKKVQVSFLSSFAVYGKAKGKLTESTPIEVLNPYAFMKYQCENMLLYYSKTLNINVSVFRLLMCYGPYANQSTFIGKLISKYSSESSVTLYHQGSQIRDFIYIDDVVNALALDNVSSGFHIFNLGGKDPTSFKQMADYFDINYTLDGDANYSDCITSDLSHLNNITKWQPQYSLEEGIAETKKILEK